MFERKKEKDIRKEKVKKHNESKKVRSERIEHLEKGT